MAISYDFEERRKMDKKRDRNYYRQIPEAVLVKTPLYPTHKDDMAELAIVLAERLEDQLANCCCECEES